MQSRLPDTNDMDLDGFPNRNYCYGLADCGELIKQVTVKMGTRRYTSNLGSCTASVNHVASRQLPFGHISQF